LNSEGKKEIAKKQPFRGIFGHFKSHFRIQRRFFIRRRGKKAQNPIIKAEKWRQSRASVNFQEI
jgi:hypothetical protein